MTDGQAERDRMRAADTDRQRVADRLSGAHAEGRIDLGEYDERVQQAWAARTYGELDRLTADLPPAVPSTRIPVPRAAGGPDGPRHLRTRRGAVAAWLSASVINLVIWAVISLATLGWIYPWWIWVAGPWGAVLLAGWFRDRFTTAEPCC